MSFYLKDPTGAIKLKVYKNEQDNTDIHLLSDAKAPDGYRFEKDVKVTRARNNTSKLQVCQLPCQSEFDILSVALFSHKNLYFHSGDELYSDQDFVFVSEKDSLFVQPAIWNIIPDHCRAEKMYYLFEISETDVKTEVSDGNVIQSMEPPTYKSTFTESSIASVSLGDYRVVLRAEDGWFDSRSGYTLNDTAKELLKFERYRVTDPAAMGDYLISVPIKDMMESLQVEDINLLLNNDNLTCLSKVLIVSLVKFTKPVIEFPYNFSHDFIGWNLIVFPFICFVEGLSLILSKYLYARIVHLSQSSGYGKTRLCFEHLRKLKRGIYCVYRGEGDSGYPKTTPWMEGLINAFRASTSDEDSVKICLSFIHWSITNFSELEDVHFKYFEHSTEIPKDLEFKYANDVTAKTIIDDPRAKEGLFTIVIDECQELLIKPKNSVNLISLYRAFRRAMNRIKDCPIVAVFLGTKSSLGDFVLSGRNKPSDREDLANADQVFDVPVYIFTHSCNSMLNRPFKVCFDTVATTKLVGGIDIPRSTVMQEIAWSCGRPLWRYYLNFGTAFSAAEMKLLQDQSLCDLTCLVMRTGAKVVPQDPLAHRLVLSGLATLVYVDIDGSRCHIDYIPEPLLSNSARIRLTQLNYLRNSLKEYVKRLQLGVFHETGVAGEQVGRIVLLRLMDLVGLFPKDAGHVDAFKVSDSKTYKLITADSLTGSNGSDRSRELADRLLAIRENAKFTTAESTISPTLVSEQAPSDPQATVSATQSETTPVQVTEGSAPGASQTSNDPITSRPVTFWTPTLALGTVRQFLLMASNGRFDDELWKLGVSDEVLDGVISFSQFSNMENAEGPLHVDQVFLMNAFSRGCALTLPDRTPGADLLIPVLRKDSLMSCIAIQIKNLDVEKFPNDDLNVSSRLSSAAMPFISLKAVGDFGTSVHADDFVRIAIQFGPGNAGMSDLYAWTKIPGSKSQAKIPEASPHSRELRESTTAQSGNQCNVLWLRGLNALEHCFFGDKVVMEYLDIILSAQRDIFSNLDYPRVPLPTFAQTTEEGVRFLNQLARPLANYSNIVYSDVQARTERLDSDWKMCKEKMSLLQLREDSFDHFKDCKMSSNVEFDSSESVPVEKNPATDPNAQDILSDPILVKIAELNKTHKGGKEASDSYQSRLKNYQEAVKEIKKKSETSQPSVSTETLQSELAREGLETVEKDVDTTEATCTSEADPAPKRQKLEKGTQ